MPPPVADGPLTRYIEQVRALPRLSREVEYDLALAARAGDRDATHRLVESNLRYAVAVALQYGRYGIAMSELIGEASLGLMMAVRKFDPERGNRFVTYAGYWIRAYVLDLVVKSSSMVGAGSGVRRSKIFFRLRRERASVAGLEGDAERQIELLADRFGVEPSKMRAMLRQLDTRDVSLDSSVNPDSNLTLIDQMRHPGDGQEEEFLAAEYRTQLRTQMLEALGILDKRERYIVEQHIMGDEELSLAELGRRMGVSRERARQLEARAKKKLRRQLLALQPDAA